MQTRALTLSTRYPTVEVSRLALREGNSKKPVYTMHKWWARRLGVIFRMLLICHASDEETTEEELWRRFYQPFSLPEGFTVLDPFLGGGTTLIEAAKQGADCIGFDIDPVACFITRQELTLSDPEAIRRRFTEIERKVAPQIRRLYRSCVVGQDVDVVYFFWVDRLTCPGCGEEHDGHPTFQLAHEKHTKWQAVVCPQCNAVADLRLDARRLHCKACGTRTDLTKPPVQLSKFRCPDCAYRVPIHELYRKGQARPRLFALEYLTQKHERGFAPVTEHDVRLYGRSQALLRKAEEDLLIPTAAIPEAGRSDRRPLLYGYRAYRDLFNPRQLYCLGLIAAEIRDTTDPEVRRALALAFSHCLASNNMFCGYAFGYRRLTPLFSVHAYRKISRPVEGHVWGLPIGRGSFGNAVRAVIEGKEYMQRPFEYQYRGRRPRRVSVALGIQEMSNGLSPGRRPPSVQIVHRSAADLSAIASGSVDLILTDPPYFDNLSYSELSDFYHVWLRDILRRDYPGHAAAHTPMTASLYAGKRVADAEASPQLEHYVRTLTQAFAECHRVGKARAGLVFTYHHRSPEAWATLGQALLPSGFRVKQIFPVRSEGQSGFHSYEGTIKWDSVLLCQRADARPRLVEPSGHSLAGLLRSAQSQVTQWATELQRAKLAFGAADKRSLGMSLVLRGFSQKNFKPTRLLEALRRVSHEPSIERGDPTRPTAQ